MVRVGLSLRPLALRASARAMVGWSARHPRKHVHRSHCPRDHACEPGTGTVGSSGGEVPAALRFHDAKHVSRAAPFILVVLLGQFPRFGRYRRSHVGVQRDRFFIQANNGLGGIIGLLVDGQHVFHLLDVRLVQLRDAPHFFPATASTRGSVAKSGLSLVLPWAPTCA
jgi:hypothetical protein